MKQALLFVHKWLGVALALLFLVWFASGIVLYFVPFPSLTPTERLAGLPPLVLDDLTAERLSGLPAVAPGDRTAERLAAPPATAVDNRCCLTAPAAAERAGITAAEARLGMHAGGGRSGGWRRRCGWRRRYRCANWKRCASMVRRGIG